MSCWAYSSNFTMVGDPMWKIFSSFVTSRIRRFAMCFTSFILPSLLPKLAPCCQSVAKISATSSSFLVRSSNTIRVATPLYPAGALASVPRIADVSSVTELQSIAETDRERELKKKIEREIIDFGSDRIGSLRRKRFTWKKCKYREEAKSS